MPPDPVAKPVLGLLAWEAGDGVTAEQMLLQVPALADDGDDIAVVAAALAQLGRVYLTQIRPREAIDVATRCLALAPATGAVEQTAWVVMV